MTRAWDSSLRAERYQRRLRRAVALGLVFLMLAILGSFFSRELEIRRLQTELSQLAIEKIKVLRGLEALQAQLQKRGDLKLVEYLARKELGLAKPGEEIYIIVESEEREP